MVYSKEEGEFYYNLIKKNEKIFHSFACLSFLENTTCRLGVGMGT